MSTDLAEIKLFSARDIKTLESTMNREIREISSIYKSAVKVDVNRTTGEYYGVIELYYD